jgi:hypothetical protein
MPKVIKFLCLSVLILSACIAPPAPVLGDFNTITSDYEVVSPGNKSTLDIELNAANLIITGGSELLVQSTFYYNVPAWKPTIRQQGDTISIKHPKTGAFSLQDLSGFHYDIDLKINPTVPIVMDLSIQQGSCQVFFDNINLQTATIATGDSDCTISFVQEWKSSVVVSIKTGRGQTIIRVPQKTGTIIQPQGLINQVEFYDLTKSGGSYTNTSWGKTPFTLTINIETGSGPVLLDGSNW